VAAVSDRSSPPPAGAAASAPTRHTRRALSAARGHLQKTALKVLAWVVSAFLLVKLIPTVKHAVRGLGHVSWEWILAAVALEVMSEFGYVTSWRSIVDPENLLASDGRGARTSTRAAWAQLGAGIVVPGGSLASIGVGAWILHRLGMPSRRSPSASSTSVF
jgi:uncharacterized membrane protein YbhN (UPF0104 family)